MLPKIHECQFMLAANSRVFTAFPSKSTVSKSKETGTGAGVSVGSTTVPGVSSCGVRLESVTSGVYAYKPLNSMLTQPESAAQRNAKTLVKQINFFIH